MPFSDFVMWQLLAILLVNNLIARLFLLIFVIVGFLMKSNIKRDYQNIVYGMCLLIFNLFFDIELDVLNFCYLGVLSFVIYVSKMKTINKALFVNGYLILVLLKGVVILWQSL